MKKFKAGQIVFDTVYQEYGVIAEVSKNYIMVSFDGDVGAVSQFRPESAQRDLIIKDDENA